MRAPSMQNGKEITGSSGRNRLHYSWSPTSPFLVPWSCKGLSTVPF